MKPPASVQCAHCGAEISPDATVCGFCQKPVGSVWILKPLFTGLFIVLILALLAVVTLWLRTSLDLAVATRQAAATLAVPPAAVPAAVPDPAYPALLAQAEEKISQQDYRLAISLLMQARLRWPDRPEARDRLERLRAQLIQTHPELAISSAPASGAPTPSPPESSAPESSPPAARPQPAGTRADLVSIPMGSFIMGTSERGGNDDERPAHEVRLSSFSIESHEVTVSQYRRFCARTRRPFPRQPAWSSPKHPVVSVTWHDAQAYCRYRGRRLPTEAEWERSARGQTSGRYAFGSLPPFIDQYAWWSNNSGEQAHPVGMLASPVSGIHDAYGNVWEWVADWYSADYYDNSPKTDPRGPRDGEEKVLRGGAYDSKAVEMALTYREKFSPDHGAENRGFRCAKSGPP